MPRLSTFETNLFPKITSTFSMIRTSTWLAINFSLIVFFYPSFTKFTFLSFFIVTFGFIYSGNIFFLQDIYSPVFWVTYYSFAIDLCFLLLLLLLLLLLQFLPLLLLLNQLLFLLFNVCRSPKQLLLVGEGAGGGSNENFLYYCYRFHFFVFLFV